MTFLVVILWAVWSVAVQAVRDGVLSYEPFDADSLFTSKNPPIYATFADNEEYLTYATVLFKSMQQLHHQYQNVLFVSAHGKLAHRAESIESAMREAGWNSKVHVFDPLNTKFNFAKNRGSAFTNWVAAWQRAYLWQLDVSRFVHLDADVLVLQNLDENMMHKATVPSFARRMGGCTQSNMQESVLTRRPITNLFVAEPDAKIAERLEERVHQYNKHATLVQDDGTVIPSMYSSFGVLRPEDLLYFDCLVAKTDSQLSSVLNPDTVSSVHLGFPGRDAVEKVLKDKTAEDVATELERNSQHLGASVVRKWYDLYASEDVQSIIHAGS